MLICVAQCACRCGACLTHELHASLALPTIDRRWLKGLLFADAFQCTGGRGDDKRSAPSAAPADHVAPLLLPALLTSTTASRHTTDTPRIMDRTTTAALHTHTTHTRITNEARKRAATTSGGRLRGRWQVRSAQWPVNTVGPLGVRPASASEACCVATFIRNTYAKCASAHGECAGGVSWARSERAQTQSCGPGPVTPRASA